MNRQSKRVIAAWWLLSVFVSMMALSSLHRHQPVANPAADCVECAHHVHHSGHFTVAGNDVHECVLCQFLSSPVIPATLLAIVFTTSPQQKGLFFLCNGIAQRKPTLSGTRAPPYLL
ncbi:MAG: hypothetical protein IJV25_06515 [Prevotella sp.]|nr:hypothetical protein [Prevotella sp.]MBQ9650060.1 hypothetical protein [Prevotella sp.]